MDLASSQQEERAWYKNHSLSNMDHGSLGPLTSRLPLDGHGDGDDLLSAESQPLQLPLPLSQSTSYLHGKSAPATPPLLSRSPTTPRSRSRHRIPSSMGLPMVRSKSSSHLIGAPARKMASGATTPRRRREPGSGKGDNPDSDWFLRTGALMSFEAREYKGQNWLVSMQSSTSLTGIRDADEEAFEQELARERDLTTSLMASRRGSVSIVADEGADDEITAVGLSLSSQSHSRWHILGENHSHATTPHDQQSCNNSSSGEEAEMGPDFVDVDDNLEELEAEWAEDDEATVRKLVRQGQPGRGFWMADLFRWPLFSVDEGEEEEEEAEQGYEEDDYGGLCYSCHHHGHFYARGDDEEANMIQKTACTSSHGPRRGSKNWPCRRFDGDSSTEMACVPPPMADEGGWKDAAWLAKVALRCVF